MCCVGVLETRVGMIFVTASDKVDLYECAFAGSSVVIRFRFRSKRPTRLKR